MTSTSREIWRLPLLSRVPWQIARPLPDASSASPASSSSCLLLGHFTATPGAAGGVIHCGDTVWLGVWWHIGRHLGPFDAAFLPIHGARVPDAGIAAS